MKILKKELKTCESLLRSRMKAIRVDKPPLRTAGPMSTKSEDKLFRLNRAR